MQSGILSLFYEFMFKIDFDLAFAVGLGVISLAFIVNTVLSVCLSCYTASKRTWFLFFVIMVNVWFYSVVQKNGKTDYLFVLIIISAISCMPCFAFSARKKKIRKEHRELARVLTNAARQAEKNEYDFPLHSGRVQYKEPTESVVKPMVEKACNVNLSENLDFNHVKNVIARLEYYALSPADRRQVNELETAIYTAEREGIDQTAKVKINDGLGVLLKIMSKYGV